MEEKTTYGEMLVGLPVEQENESAMAFNLRTSRAAAAGSIDQLYALCSESECTAEVKDYAQTAIQKFVEAQKLAEIAFVSMDLIWDRNRR